jgi:hypothetical protein
MARWTVLLQLAQQVVDPLGLGHERRAPDQVGPHAGCRPAPAAQHVLGVDDADDVVAAVSS